MSTGGVKERPVSKRTENYRYNLWDKALSRCRESNCQR